MTYEYLLEREITDNVTVEHKEGFIIFSENLTGEGEGASSAEGLLLVREGDGDPKPGRLHLHLLLELVGLVADRQHHMIDPNSYKGLNLVQQDGLVGELHQGLRLGEGERPQSGAVTANQDQGLHLPDFDILSSHFQI